MQVQQQQEESDDDDDVVDMKASEQQVMEYIETSGGGSLDQELTRPSGVRKSFRQQERGDEVKRSILPKYSFIAQGLGQQPLAILIKNTTDSSTQTETDLLK